MPDPSLLTASTYALLDELPEMLRDDPDVIAVHYATANLFDELFEAMDRVTANLLPNTADDLTFAIWEALFGVSPGTQTDEQRSAVLAARARESQGSGSSWIEGVTLLIGPGWEYEEHVPGVDVMPSRLTVVVRIPFSPTSDEFARIQDFLVEWSPANIQIILQSMEGFALDVSQLDEQTL